MSRRDAQNKRPHVVHMTTVPESLIFLAGQCSFLQANGWQVSAVSSPGSELEEFALSEGIDVLPVRMTRSISPLRDIASLFQLVRLLLRLRPDIVHAHTPKAGLLGMISAFIVRVPARIYHVHGLPLETARGPKRLLLALSERVALRMATHVLAVSPSIVRVAEELRLIQKGKAAVLGEGSINGIDAMGRFDPAGKSTRRSATLEQLSIPDSAQVVGFVGRIVADKGINELVTAWARLSEDYPLAHLLLVGKHESENPLAPEIRQAIETDPSIHDVGFVNDTENYYSAFDVLVLPSHREGFGLAAAEALSMEVPVVGTRIAGLVDVIVDGVTGTLVDVGDVSMLCKAVGRYLSDPGLARAHACTGRESVIARFSPQRIRSETLSLYADILSK